MRVIVLGTNASGEPEFCSCQVEAGVEAIHNGDHYDLAILHATQEGYEGPFLAFDENDQAARQLADLAEWLGENRPADSTQRAHALLRRAMPMLSGAGAGILALAIGEEIGQR